MLKIHRFRALVCALSTVLFLSTAFAIVPVPAETIDEPVESSPALAQSAHGADAGDDSTTDRADRTDRTEEVVVTASRYGAESGMNVTNITRADLKMAEPDQAFPLLLQNLPGVFSRSDAGSGLGYSYLTMRGFDQRRVGVLFNGIPFNDPEDHQIWWVDLPDLASSIEDVQVQRGITNSVGGMTAIGGTVNIVSRELSEEPQGSLSVSYGSYETQKQMLQYQTGNLGDSNFRSMLRLSRQQSDGYRDRSGHDGWAVFWSGQYDTGNTTTRANLYTGREITQHAWDAVPESVLRENRRANVETYHNAIDDFRQPHYELHHTWRLTDAMALTNRLYHIRGEGFYENFKDGEDVASYSLDRMPGYGMADSAEVDLIRRKWVRKQHTGWVPHLEWNREWGRLLLGGDWYTFHSDHWGEVLWAEGGVPGDFVDPWRYHDYDGDKDQYSLYASQRIDLGDLSLTADLHYQHKEYTFRQNEVGNFAGDLLNGYTVDYDFFNPKGSLSWRLPQEVAGGSTTLFGSVGVNHREPTDNELFNIWMGGDDLGAEPLFGDSREVTGAGGDVQRVEWFDPYVSEERVVDYELAVAWRSETARLHLGGYWMDFEDEIVAYGGVNDDGSSIRGNAEETRHKGIEAQLDVQVSERHRVSLSGSRSWDEFVTFMMYEDSDWDGLADTVHDYSGNPIALFPEYLAQAGWETQWTGDLRTRLRVRSTGRQHLDNSGDDERVIDAWTTVDLSLWLDLDRFGLAGAAQPRLFVHLRNLGDTEYETWGYWYGENWYTPGSGRNFIAGVSADF